MPGDVQGLKPALAVDGALRAQLATMLSQTMNHADRISGIPETAAPRRCAICCACALCIARTCGCDMAGSGQGDREQH